MKRNFCCFDKFDITNPQWCTFKVLSEMFYCKLIALQNQFGVIFVDKLSFFDIKVPKSNIFALN